MQFDFLPRRSSLSAFIFPWSRPHYREGLRIFVNTFINSWSNQCKLIRLCPRNRSAMPDCSSQAGMLGAGTMKNTVAREKYRSKRVESTN